MFNKLPEESIVPDLVKSLTDFTDEWKYDSLYKCIYNDKIGVTVSYKNDEFSYALSKIIKKGASPLNKLFTIDELMFVKFTDKEKRVISSCVNNIKRIIIEREKKVINKKINEKKIKAEKEKENIDKEMRHRLSRIDIL